MLRIAERGKCLLKLLYDRSADKPCGPQAVTESIRQFLLEFTMRSYQVQKRDWCRAFLQCRLGLYITEYLCRIPGDDRVRRDAFRHHGARSHNRILADLQIG